jgi:hypothetical protein
MTGEQDENRLLLVVGPNAASVANSIINWASNIDVVGLLCSDDKGVKESADKIEEWLSSGGSVGNHLEKYGMRDAVPFRAPRGRSDKIIRCEKIQIPRFTELSGRPISLKTSEGDLVRTSSRDVIDCRVGTKLHAIRLVNMVMSNIVDGERPKICTTNALDGSIRLLKPPQSYVETGSQRRCLDVGSLLFLSHGDMPSGFKPRLPDERDIWVISGENGENVDFFGVDELEEKSKLSRLPPSIRTYFEPMFDRQKVGAAEGFSEKKLSRDKSEPDGQISQLIIGKRFEAVVLSQVMAWCTSRGLNGADMELWTNLIWETQINKEEKRTVRESDIILRIGRKFAFFSVKGKFIQHFQPRGKLSQKKKIALKEMYRHKGEARMLRAVPRPMREVFLVVNFEYEGMKTRWQSRAEEIDVRLCNPRGLWSQLDQAFGFDEEE